MAEYSWLCDDIETLSTYIKDGYTKAVLNQAVNAIRKLSSGVAPVRHGRWERTSKSLMVCTACGNCVVDDRISGMFYCPNCGAKMDDDTG